jgi:hypothetical protein
VLAVLLINPLVVLVCAGVWFWDTRPYRDGPAAQLSWTTTGKPGQFECTVVDLDGNPMPGVFVHAHNDSGGQAGTTDNEGVVRLSVSKGIDEITLNGIRVWGPRFFHPPIDKGVLMTIVVKDPSALNQGPLNLQPK